MAITEHFGLEQNRLLKVLQYVTEATAVYSDAELTIAFANEGMLRIWGKDEAVIGGTFEAALPEMEGQPFTQLLRSAWATGETYAATATAAQIVVDGRLQTFYFDFIYRPLLNDQGKTYAMLHTATEVSARLALQLAEQRLQQLVASSPVGMCIIDGYDLVIGTANEQMLSIWGRSREQVMGKKLMEVFPDLEGQAFPQLLRDVLDTGRSVTIKETAADIAAIDGTPRRIYIDLGYEPLTDASGKVTSILATVTGITEIVRNRQLLEASEALSRDLNEELAASNEEYITLNEELSALNEEYTAVNEELTAANEQLDEISRELQNANDKLSRANAGLRVENEHLLLSEAKALSLFADAPVAIGLLAGKALVVESANTSLLQLWGKGAEVIGLPLAQALPELTGQPFLGILDQVLLTGEPFYGTEQKAALVYEGVLTDRYFNFVYQPIKDEDGRAIYIMVVATDVTVQVDARKDIEKAKENFQLIADNISQFAWMADPEGSIFWYNQRWFDYTGTTLEAMRGWGWREVHHPEHVDRVVEKIARNFKTGESWEDTFPLRRADGEYRWFLSRMVPTRDQNGKVISWFGTNTDITDQRKLDQQKDDFISIASHELKTPLTSLKANLQLLERMKDNLSNPMAPKLIDSSNKSMQKISTLVDDLLNINRFSEGKLQLQKTRFSVWEMLNACSSHVRVDGKHELIVEGDKQLQIYADEHRIDQVVVNFVNNAVKYAPHGRKIWLIIDDLGSEVKISVKDTGPGIPAEQLPHLFDRYWQADQSAPKYNGLGLGLFICAEIIKRHGGHIGADSALGEGSTFWFTLPKSS